MAGWIRRTPTGSPGATGPALPRWTWIAVAALLMAIGTPWLLWSALHGANPVIAAKLVAYEVRSDTEIDVRITVERPDGVPGVCGVKAQAVGTDTVGEIDIVLEPGTDRLETVDTPDPHVHAAHIGVQ